MTKGWVICLGASNSQVPLILKDQSLGYSILAIDRDPEAPGFKFSDESMIESTHHSDYILEKIKDRKWGGLLARCTGGALFTAADIVKKHNIAGVSYELVDIATSKSAMRQFCSDNNIKAPHGLRVSSSQEYDFREFVDQIIVKPDFTIRGKESISKVNSTDKRKVRNSIESALLSSGNTYAEIEDFIEGYDCSYLAWIEKGKSSVILTWDELVGFDEKSTLLQFGVSTPSISSITQQSIEIEKIVDSFANLFPHVSTLLSFSFRIDHQGIPWLIEVHADMTGDMILDKLVPAATGYDFLLDITKLFINCEFGLDNCLKSAMSLKPTAMLYKNSIVNSSDDLVLMKPNLFALHNEINTLLGGVVLEQKIFLDKKDLL